MWIAVCGLLYIAICELLYVICLYVHCWQNKELRTVERRANLLQALFESSVNHSPEMKSLATEGNTSSYHTFIVQILHSHSRFLHCLSFTGSLWWYDLCYNVDMILLIYTCYCWYCIACLLICSFYCLYIVYCWCIVVLRHCWYIHCSIVDTLLTVLLMYYLLWCIVCCIVIVHDMSA